MKVGIVIEDWKLPIFTKHLKEFDFEINDGVTHDTLHLTVETDSFGRLQDSIRDAVVECGST